MRATYLAPLISFLFCLSLGMTLFTLWDRADSAERRAQGWEEAARKQGAALDKLLKADAELKAADDRLQRALMSKPGNL